MNEHDGFDEKLQEIKMAIQGLSIEVESWRIHTSGTGEFVLDALRELHIAVNKLQTALK